MSLDSTARLLAQETSEDVLAEGDQWRNALAAPPEISGALQPPAERGSQDRNPESNSASPTYANPLNSSEDAGSAEEQNTIINNGLFDSYGTLPDHLRTAAKHVMTFALRHAPLDESPDSESPRAFNWTGFKSEVCACDPTLMTMELFNTTTLNEHTADIQVMVGRIVELLLKLAINVVDQSTLSTRVASAFQNLRKHKVSSLGSYTKTKTNSDFDYMVYFAIRNPYLPDEFYALVCTISLHAVVRVQGKYYGFWKAREDSFTAVVTYVKLAVSKDFRVPNHANRFSRSM